MTTNPPVPQPDGEVPELTPEEAELVAGAIPLLCLPHSPEQCPERLWLIAGGPDYTTEGRTGASDVEYVRAPSPDSIGEKVSRAAERIDEMLTSGGDWSPGIERLVAIVAAEFGGGGDENKT